jgi:hypothetical protein
MILNPRKLDSPFLRGMVLANPAGVRTEGAIHAGDAALHGQATKVLWSDDTSYTIRHEINPNHAAIVFEFDQQSEAELLRDFPWLRRIGVSAFGNRHPQGSEQGSECLPESRHSQHRESSVALYRLWSRVRALVSLRRSASA